jgi:arylsulfatase A-like enzyme
MAERLNLLYIFTDQQRADTMAAYGNDWINTPNLNRLSEDSFVFENCYVSSPICTPSRSTQLTGLWPHTNGCVKNNIPLPQSVDTVADHIPDDYHRAYYGKWHLGDEVIKRRGWDEWHSIEDQYRIWHTTEEHDEVLSNYHYYLLENGYEPDIESRGKRVFSRPYAAALPEEHTKASYLGREVSRFIGENKERPWALYVNLFEPHPPYDGPFLMHSLMAEAQKAGVDGPAQAVAARPFGSDVPPEEAIGEGPMGQTEAAFRDVQARYYGLVTLVDKAVGKMLDALEETGQAGRTVVVFTSEHGDQMGDHNIFQKIVMYEDSVRVPMLVRVPGTDGGRVPGRYSHIDTVPTLLELIGAEVPGNLEGESKAKMLRENGNLAENDVIITWNGRSIDLKFPLTELERMREIPHRCLIDADGWKINLSVGDACELYDLNSDPYETTNLYTNPEHSERIVSMAKKIRQWQRDTGDTVLIPDVYPGTGFVPEMHE